MHDELRTLLEAFPIFDPLWYSKKYGYSREEYSSDELLDLYLEGKGEPCAIFSSTYIKNQNGVLTSEMSSPEVLTWVLKNSGNQVDTSSGFSSRKYLQVYPEAQTSGLSAFLHFMTKGRALNYCGVPSAITLTSETLNAAQIWHHMHIIAQSGLFDEAYYRASYNVDDSLCAVEHYVCSHRDQAYNPNALFDTAYYLEHYSSYVKGAHPLLHYIAHGEASAFNPSLHFSVDLYRRQNQDLTIYDKTVLSHYLLHGMQERRPVFTVEEAKYIPDVYFDESALLPPLKETAETEKGGRVLHPMDFGPAMQLYADYEDKQVPLKPSDMSYTETLSIHFVLPDFKKGSGGHMTLFRMVHFLERLGHRLSLWITSRSFHKDSEQAYQTLVREFQHFSGSLHFIDEGIETASGDIIVATDCWSVWPVLSAQNFKKRFYLVQDYEPLFFPMGSHYRIAEETYKKDFHCLCASPWLATKMKDHGREATYFNLAADLETFYPSVKKERPNPVPRIIAYARMTTERRAVELLLLGLKKLSERGVEFEVDLFGDPHMAIEFPFRATVHGVVTPHEMATLFRAGDIGLVFSSTNYSLIPQEMMACGLPLVELRGESTEAIFPEDCITLTEASPASIATNLESLLQDRPRAMRQSEKALEWVSAFSWTGAAERIEKSFYRALQEENGFHLRTQDKKSFIKASVVIPTYNAGPLFNEVLAKVVGQVAPWDFEICIVDSGSTDETLEIISAYPSIKLVQIPNEDFNHGGTRNFGASHTTGEFIAYITQDAMPATDDWLFNLVSGLERYPNAAGAFGRHIAYEACNPFTQVEIKKNFDLYAHLPVNLSAKTVEKLWHAKDQRWLLFLHFLSNNNSCLRRQMWETIPFREISYGEDQAWAMDCITAGYEKVYVDKACVYHSHDYTPEQQYERMLEEANLLINHFGYQIFDETKSKELLLNDRNEYSYAIADRFNIGQDAIDEQLRLNESVVDAILKIGLAKSISS
ncbi:glycosyltransferase [Temperatibacter marinus]|uniref:Glycosyltransferase n=1 Tax=Temperatibacter marinus TaxID=1456591 RepID=A0AA52H9R3_9PROT|nr:glycosyltransferase [Temperatibacter marinus]WND03189.1 glycosyltransferase [Temperatibacter marinus]